MLKKHVGSHVAVIAIGAVGVFACSSSGSTGFPEGDAGNTGLSSGYAGSSGGGNTGSSSGYTGSSSGGNTGSSSGYTGSSSSGTTATTTSSGTTSGTTSSSGSGGTCTESATGGLALMSGYAMSGVVTGAMGGYAFAYSDSCTPTASSACVSMTSFCGAGNSVASGTNYSTCYGGGIGINVNQMNTGTSPAIGTLAATGTGITYALSGPTIPSSGLRLQICDAAPVGGTCPTADTYCAALTASSGTVTWSMFNTKCYDSPPDGTALSAAPASLSQVQFQVASASATATPWDFCVTSLSL